MDSHHRIAGDFDRVIVRDDTTSGSSTTEDDPNIQKLQNTRERLYHILEGYKFQLGIVFIVIFDCLLVVSELMIDIQVLELHETHGRATTVIRFISMAILCVFLVEIGIKVYAFRLSFFRRKLEVFDAIVVVASFALDVVFRDHHGAVNGIGLLIILRLWRVVRILNGVVMSVKIHADRRLYRERREKEALEQELNKYRDYCIVQEQEIESLRGLLKKHGVEVSLPDERPISGIRMDVEAEVNEGTFMT